MTLKELIDEYIELEEKLDEIEDDESEEYNKIAEKLDGKGHEIDHLVYRNSLLYTMQILKMMKLLL